GARCDRKVLTHRPRQLLPRVEQVLRVEETLDLLVQLERARAPLARELAAFEDAESVLARDRAAEPDGEVEEILDRELGARELVRLLGIDEEGRVQVAVARVPERERDQVVA